MPPSTVSSPYRYSNNRSLPASMKVRTTVSSPYRYSNNEIQPNQAHWTRLVSSPYRYSNNYNRNDGDLMGFTRFKSL